MRRRKFSINNRCFASALLVAALTACGGGGDSPTAPLDERKTIVGNVAGLEAGQAVVLQNNGAEDFSVGVNGPFSSAASWPLGTGYAVSVKTQPTGQLCTVSSGSGTLSATPTSVRVDCIKVGSSYTLGGNVKGIPIGQTLVLSNGIDEDLAVSADGGFTFTKPLPDKAKYAVALKTVPTGQGCVVRNGSGSISASAVNSVSVTCSPLDQLAGSWEQDKCEPGVGAWERSFWVFRSESGSQGAATGTTKYTNERCEGKGVDLLRTSQAFTFQQERYSLESELAAFWGTRVAMPDGVLQDKVISKVVLVRKANYLCLVDDGTPSIWPTATSLASTVSRLIASGNCYASR